MDKNIGNGIILVKATELRRINSDNQVRTIRHWLRDSLCSLFTLVSLSNLPKAYSTNVA